MRALICLFHNPGQQLKVTEGTTEDEQPKRASGERMVLEVICKY
jgi:hypothetical protein